MLLAEHDDESVKEEMLDLVMSCPGIRQKSIKGRPPIFGTGFMYLMLCYYML